MNILKLYSIFNKNPLICTDSRKTIQKKIFSQKLFLAIREQEELWMQMGKPEHIGIQHNTKDGTAELMDLREVELQNPTED